MDDRNVYTISPVLSQDLEATKKDLCNPAYTSLVYGLWCVPHTQPVLTQVHATRIRPHSTYTRAQLLRAIKTLTANGWAYIEMGHTSQATRIFPSLRFRQLVQTLLTNNYYLADLVIPTSPVRNNRCVVREPDGKESRMYGAQRNSALVGHRTSQMTAQEALRGSQRLVGIRRHLPAHVAAQCAPVDRSEAPHDDQMLIIPDHLLSTYCIFYRENIKSDIAGGGRQYHALQSMLTSEQRQHLMVMNSDRGVAAIMPTSEVDIVCAQPRILFALAGIPMPSEDLYEHIRTHHHNTISRAHAKALMMYVIGAETPTYRGYRACRAARALAPDDGQMTKEHYLWVWDEVLAPVRYLLDGPTWGHLQRAESDWLFGVLDRLSRRSIAAWTWHDSIRVSDEHVEALQEAMEDAWTALFDTPLTTTTDRGVAAITTSTNTTPPNTRDDDDATDHTDVPSPHASDDTRGNYGPGIPRCSSRVSECPHLRGDDRRLVSAWAERFYCSAEGGVPTKKKEQEVNFSCLVS